MAKIVQCHKKKKNTEQELKKNLKEKLMNYLTNWTRAVQIISCIKYNQLIIVNWLLIVNQILDKLVYNGLSKYWDKHDIILSGQFGFRANHSTEHAILLITDKKYRQQLKTCGHFSCGIFLDLSKEVDTSINHCEMKK